MQTLDVVLGLIFLYLLLALVCTAANELIAQWINMRATTLMQGIHTLLGGSGRLVDPAIAADSVKKARAQLEQAKEVVRKNAPAEYDAYRLARVRADKARADAAVASSYAREKSTAINAAEVALKAATKNGLATEITAASNAANTARQEHAEATTGAKTARSTAVAEEQSERAAETVLESAFTGSVRKLTQAQAAVDEADRTQQLAILYGHPLIASLSQVRRAPWGTKIRLPSYIPSRVFATALLDTIEPTGNAGAATLANLRTAALQLPPQLSRPLLLFIDDAGSDIERLRTSISRWYEDSMERVSGLYKRKTQVVTLATAFVVTCMLNADSIRIWRVLSSNATLREAVVARAQALANTPPDVVRRQLAADSARQAAASVRQSGSTQGTISGKPTTQGTTRTTDDTSSAGASDTTRQTPDATTPQADIRLLMNDVRSMGLPIGWNLSERDSTILASSRFLKSPRDTTRRWTPVAYLGVYGPPIWQSLPGLLLTMFAVSLGAPFWFDLLNKVVNIRSAGRAPEENPKSPEALPPPR